LRYSAKIPPLSYVSIQVSAKQNEWVTRCDLCGGAAQAFVLETPRLDGPLVRCSCGLYFVAKPVAANAPTLQITVAAGPQQAADEMARLAERARELALVEPAVEANESPWRTVTAQERLRDLRRFITSGRMLEIGCSTGEMLAAAQAAFAVKGVEADATTSAQARAKGLDCWTGTLFDAPLAANEQNVIALYHVIEHLPSPQAALAKCHELLAPNGWLVLEAPNIQTIWFRLLGARWRQFIPDHIFFFTPATLGRLCEQNGFVVLECRSVGKAMSVRLFISRVGRFSPLLARGLSFVSRTLQLDDLTIRLKLGDVMRLYAQKR
jgi:2-polyprenyl-3-methyl-5-hydroxy-6-metoxy-1,4-benzoquinol methylase